MLSKIRTESALAASFGSRTLSGKATIVSSNLYALYCRLVSLAVSISYLRYPLFTRLVQPLQEPAQQFVTSCANFLRLLNRISLVNHFFAFRHFADSLRNRFQSFAQRKISKHRNDPLASRGALSSKGFQTPQRLLFSSPAVAWAWIGSVRLECISPRLITAIKRLDCAPTSPLPSALLLKSPGAKLLFVTH